jgi:hypothetical protein
VAVSSGAYYLFAGGRAFGVPSPAALARLRRQDRAMVLHADVTAAQRGATVANGVLLSTSGLVYVSYEGYFWPFRSGAQLVSDGYGGTAAVPVPAVPGPDVITAYSGP